MSEYGDPTSPEQVEFAVERSLEPRRSAPGMLARRSGSRSGCPDKGPSGRRGLGGILSGQ